MKKVIAVDFDGVIHDYKHPVPGRKMGTPMHGAKEALEALKLLGFRIVVQSVWGHKTEVIEEYMRYWELPFDEVTSQKPDADFYIDDKGIKFDCWTQVLQEIERYI